jgi:acylphosphatase
MRKHYQIKVSGRVQGVFFRASTKTSADHANVKGFVRNEQDGSVYIEAEGDEKDLQQFIKWCSQGPSGAKVQTCDITEGALKNFSDFKIER